jgi:hypothetical protein
MREKATIRPGTSAWAVLVGISTALALSLAPAQAAGATLEVVGHDDLQARGLNAGLAVAGPCAYVGSRGTGPIAILDVSDPSHPHHVGALSAQAGTTHRELRAYPDGHWLVVLDYALSAGGANQLLFYRWADDCFRPTLAASYSFGIRSPHEMYLWRDPVRPARVLLFVTMFSGGAADLQVIDASDPAAPTLLATWPPERTLPAALHSISLAPDGRTAYLADWTGGLLIADSSGFADGVSHPEFRLLTAPASAYRPRSGNVHSAVPVPGRRLVVVTDERYPVPAGAGCPFGPARLVDVSDPAHPREVATMAIPENSPSVCRGAPAGTWTSHNPTLTPNLALVSWYSGGIEVFDTSQTANPQRLAELRPSGPRPRATDAGLGSTAAMTWSYPVVRDGLIFVVDINQGLYVLRYRGPHEDELAELAFAEGNSNLGRTASAPTPAATTAPLGNPLPSSAPAGAHRGAVSVTVLAALLGALLAAGLALALLARRFRRRSHGE